MGWIVALRRQAAKQSQAYRGAIAAAGLVPYVIDYDARRFSFMGEGIHKLTGYSVEEFTPACFKEIVLETRLWGQAPDLTPDAARKKFRSGELDHWGSDLRIRTGSGEERWVSDVSVPLRNEQGRITSAIGVIQDITERKQAEAALERTARNNELMRKCMVAISACPDLDSALDCLMHKAIELGGMDAGAVYLIEGSAALLRHHAGMAPEFVEKMNRLPVGTVYMKAAIENPREVLDVVSRFPEIQHWGETYGLRHVYCIALLADREAFGFINVASRCVPPPKASDIELVRILALEIESVVMRLQVEQRLRSVLATMAEGVYVQAANGSIIDCNRNAERILGLGRDQMGRVSGDPRWQAVREDGATFPADEHPAMVSLRTGRACHDVTMGFQLPDGSQKWININAEPMFKGGESRPYAVVTSFNDITTRRLLEERVRQAQKMESISHLAGGMAHEFNNIFAAITLNLNLAKMLSAGTEVGEHVQDVEVLSGRAAGLIRQLLAFSRQSMMTLRPTDLAALVSKQAKMLHRLLGERITLELSLPEGLPWVNADAALIEQVLLNLCLNARDAMKAGGVLRLGLAMVEVGMAQAEAREGAQPGRHVCLSVTDTGCGMDARTMRCLFEPFFTTKDVGQGTGLGLATVRGIVGQLKGWVEVESCLAKGSTFQVYLPPVNQPAATPLLLPARSV